MLSYTFKSKIWLYPTNTGAWHFVTVPKEVAAKIKQKAEMDIKKGKIMRRGFGSRRVRAKIGKTVWDTSIFPDSKSGTYLLPVKASVRGKEMTQAGDMVKVVIEVVS